MAAAALAAILLLSVPAAAAPQLSAEKAILIDADTGRVIYEKSADTQSLIASTTKIMTALLVCERCDLGAKVTIPAEAVGVEGSSMYLREGETLSVQDLLYGLMLHSGNDAAVALAIHCAGTEAEFVALMNEKAQELGLSDTRYGNPNGLDHAENYSTAHDLARLSACALKNEDFLRTVSCKRITVGERVLQNHNKMLFRYEGAIGVKTGYTKAAGRILVSAAERGGRQLIAVTINAPDDWDDHTALLDFGFSGYRSVEIVKEGTPLTAVPLAGGAGSAVLAEAGESLSLSLAEGEDWHMVLRVPQLVYAPVSAGAPAGCAEIYVGDVRIAGIPLRFAANAA